MHDTGSLPVDSNMEAQIEVRLANGPLPGLVSIIVPVYNSERHLPSCIESAIGQSYENIELLLIDDGSTDGSGKLCDDYALGDCRIHVEHANNGGPASARNMGIAQSKGEFLFFLDSDDRIERNAIRLLVDNQQRTRADLVIGDFTIRHCGVQVADSTFLLPEDALLLRRDIIARTLEYLKKPTAYAFLTYVWGKLFRASIIKDKKVFFNPGLRIFEDIDLNVRYLHHAGSVSYVKNKLYVYTSYPNPGIPAYPLGYKPALNTIHTFLSTCGVPAPTLQRDIGNAHVYFAIRIMVALFRRGQRISIWRTRALISTIVDDPDLRNSLKYYNPARGDSWTIPKLVRLKLVMVIMAVCLYKARGRRSSASRSSPGGNLHTRRISRMPDSKSVPIASNGLPVIIFGVGTVGEAVFHACHEAGITVTAFCDNNANLAREVRCGLEIIPARDLKRRFPEADFIISAADIADVVRQLGEMGYSNWRPCTGLLRNFDIYPYTYQKPPEFVAHTVAAALLCQDSYTTPDKLFLRCVDLMITEKCSMKCKDCANLMQFYEAPVSDDTAEIIRSIERFCSIVDEVNEMRVLGGEAFMNKEAHIIVRRLIDEPKVKKIVVYSNATIVPTEDQMATMRSGKVLFFITDYGSLSRNRDRLLRELESNHIAYVSSRPANWTDCGHISPHNRTEEERKQIFKTCCVKNIFTISGNLLFHCPFSANAFRLRGVPDFKGDYVDFSRSGVKDEVREFVRSKEYIDSCDFCNGRSYGAPEIVPGIQTLVPLKYEKCAR